MSAYIKRLFIFLTVCILAISCTLEKAEKEYKKGNYVESMKIVFDYLDKKPENISKINPKIKEELTQKFSYIISHYSRIIMLSEDSNEKLKANTSLFIIYSMIEGREYTKNFSPLNDFINNNKISYYYENAKKLSNELFQYNMNTVKDYNSAIDATDYLLHIDEAINNALKNVQNISLDSKYGNYKKDIAKTRADNYITVAQLEENFDKYNMYRNAQKLYLKASEIYSQYEKNYRNSYENYLSVKNKADLIDAENNYDKGLKAYNDSKSSRASYRNANIYFKKSAEFIPDYKDTTRLINETEKGYFTYRIASDDSSLLKLISDAMNPIGKKSGNDAELAFEYRENISYNISNPRTDIENLTEQVEIGRDFFGSPIYENYSFTKKTVTLKEIVTINYFFNVRSQFYSNIKNDSVSYENTVTNITYSGNIPPKYSDKSVKPLGKAELNKKVRPELERKFSYQLRSVINDLERL